MEHAALAGTDSVRFSDGGTRRALSAALGTTEMAINHYRLAPGASLPGGLHAHMDQEEVFIVLDGRATFETLHGEIAVGEAEAIRFEPGEFQSGTNRSDEAVELLAIGAPRDSTDVRIPARCPACGFDGLRLDSAGERFSFECPRCDADHVPRDCPDCGSEELQTALSEEATPIVQCQECDATFQEPPVKER